MTALVVAALAGWGMHLLATALLHGWRGLRPVRTRAPRRRSHRDWMAQAGLAEVPVSELALVAGLVGVVGGLGAWLLFAGVAPALVTAGLCCSFPVAAYRRRRHQRLDRARDHWPALIERLRVLTGAGGRSIPQALIDVGHDAPPDLQPAFERAAREWRLTTDLERMLAVLKEHLADATADAVAETLLIAHEVGGTDLDSRLAALSEDRRLDTDCRRDARARQAGVRFARRFVLLVPFGMALAGLSVGDGRSAYATAWGQTIVVVAMALVVACWWWAGRLLRLPDEQRVFAQ